MIKRYLEVEILGYGDFKDGECVLVTVDGTSLWVNKNLILEGWITKPITQEEFDNDKLA